MNIIRHDRYVEIVIIYLKGGDRMTYRMNIADEVMLKRALTSLMTDVEDCWLDEREEDLDKYTVASVVNEIVDIFKEFGTK